MMLQNMAGIQPEMAGSMAMMIGILDLVSGALVLLGLLIRPAAIFQVIILVGAMILFGFDFCLICA
jgi:uncharacterized membrane protein YphA (DoxX/SURF4 family)